MFSSVRVKVLFAVLLTLASASIGRAQATRTWTGLGGSNHWANPGNWDTGVPVSGDTAQFIDAGNGITSIDLNAAAQPINSILFDTANVAAYTLGTGTPGDAFNFDASGAITVNSTVTNLQTINAGIQTNGLFTIAISSPTTAAGLTLAGVISGSGPVTINNVGNVRINGQNTYTGGTSFPTTATQGQLQIAADTVGAPGSITFGPFGTGTITTSSALPQIFQPVGADRTIANAWDFNPGGIFVSNNTTIDPTLRNLTLTGPVSIVGNRAITNNLKAGATLTLGSPSTPSTITLGGTLAIQSQIGTAGPGGGITIVNDSISGAFGMNVQNGAVATITNNNTMSVESNVQNSAANQGISTLIVNNVPVNSTDAGIAGGIAIRTGTLAGSGTIAGNARVLTSANGAAHLAPGNGAGFQNGAGKLTFYNNLDFSGSTNCSGCNYDAEIGGTTPGTQYDQVVVNGTATIGTSTAKRGTLSVTLINGFTRPAVDTSFEVLKAGTLANTNNNYFATVNLPNNDTTNWSVSYTPTSVLVNVLGTGDFNHDHVVDAADYVTWRADPAATPAGYDAWRRNFGNTVTGSGSGLSGNSDVPEPAAIALLALGLLPLASRRRGCRSVL